MIRFPRSLTIRVLALSTLWAVLSLVAIATVISALYRQSSERSFDSLLSAHLFNLIGAASVSPDGRLQGSPDLGDVRYVIPRSGWYWSVEPLSENLEGRLRSLSFIGNVDSPTLVQVPFDNRFQRSYAANGLNGERVKVIENEFVLDDQNRIARFRVMGNLSELEAEIAEFEHSVYAYLFLFGLGTVAFNAAAILFGLKPLARVRAALSAVREGTAHRLDGVFPPEVEPLVNETNALIENNRRIVERSRTQVGNLAHSLKTPLAIIMNEGRAMNTEQGRLLDDQAKAMRQQIENYLQRARIAAQRDSVVFRTSVRQPIERLARVMEKLNPEKRIDLVFGSDADIIFAGEEGDLEEITGNLFENAMKWSRERTRISTDVAQSAAGADRFLLTIEDDGPGIAADQRHEALKRGKRLDETKPGSGLGLSIVSDLVSEYGGALRLDRSELGGLKVIVELPRAT
ncbi:sensor histidine kinase [Tianweitania sediminis]|uniref:histidine kinase n=1 Tax=Tianweitania sediminis TaxID=1502156 RepID=A0A8J7RI98_9HYPH|nr:sensor histidine kinase [Tianweitania sediminis]MBP0438911.1 sensor histidine kinase [Tianweitania sediminis]